MTNENTSGNTYQLSPGQKLAAWTETEIYRILDPSGRQVGEESRPYLGSAQYAAASGMMDLASEILGRYTFTIDGMKTLRSSWIAELTKTLMYVADMVQHRLTLDGRVDRMCASHTRIRGVMYSLFRSGLLKDPPFGEPVETWRRWRTHTIEAIAKSMNTLTDVLENTRTTPTGLLALTSDQVVHKNDE